MDETEKDNVGFSLLTNENPLTINNDDQEDAEAEEDQRRRQQELQSMLAYAFDDIGDENSTVNSSFEGSSSNVLTSGHAGYEESSKHNSEIHLEDHYSQHNTVEQLQMLYQVQAREIKRLNSELSGIQEEKSKEINLLKRQLLLSEAEHNGTKISLKQCQDLLVEKRRDMDERLKEISKLKDVVNDLTLAKRNSEEETQIWKTRSTELEQKLNLIDQGLYVPVSERQIRSKFEQDISELQDNLEQSQKNLEKALKAKAILENEIKEMKQSREFLVMEKEEEIHNLCNQLENSKFQCHNLTERMGSLEKEYQNLTTILNNTIKEQENTMQPSSMKTLHQELKRSIDDQKLKRDEITKLEDKLEQQKKKELNLEQKIKDLEAKNTNLQSNNQMLQKENDEMVEKVQVLSKNVEDMQLKLEGNFKEELNKLQADYRNAETEKEDLLQQLDSLKNEIQSKEKTEELKRSGTKEKERELEMLKLQNEQLYKQLEETNKLKKEIELQSLKKIQELQIEIQPNVSDRKMSLLEEEAALLNTQKRELQKMNLDLETNLETCKQQRTNYEQLCLELEKTCAKQKSSLYECHSKISELEGKLILKEKRDDLLDDLQQKALMFEEYLKHKTDVEVHNKSVNTEEIFQQASDAEKYEKVLKAQYQSYLEISNENQLLKERIALDAEALNELKDAFGEELDRLNSLIKELQQEVELKNKALDENQQNVSEEISKMNLVIDKLRDSLRYKDTSLKEYQQRQMDFKKQQEEIYQKIKEDYQRREGKLLTQFEKNLEEMKTRFQHDELHMKRKYENIEKICVNGLDEINQKISSNMKVNSDKFEKETKIIETYYDILIQRAKLRQK